MASERTTNWYQLDPLGPVYEVEGSKSTKDHKVMVAPSLLHARKYFFLPRTTVIIKQLANFGLEKWKTQQLMKAVVAFPLDKSLEGLAPNQIEEVIEEYSDLILAKSSEFTDYAADRGKQIHAYVQKVFEGKPVEEDPIAARAVECIAEKFGELGVVEVRTEVSFGSRELGYAGTPDLDCVCADGSEVMVDMKTTELKKFKKPHREWLLQGGSYRVGTRKKPGCRFLQAVIDRDTGETVFPEHTDCQRWEEAFMCMFNFWCLDNNYDPRKVEAPVA